MFQEKVGQEKMVTLQLSGESLGRGLPRMNPWLQAGKNSRAGHGKVKAGLFRDIHIP